MNQRTPHVYAIPAQVSFADSLAVGVREKYGQTAESLSRVTLLLPTRRACRTVRDAFLRQSGGTPLLLPRMHPLGDLDEDELTLSSWQSKDGLHAIAPAITPLRRQLLLTRLIPSFEETPKTADQSVQLAQELAKLLDQVHNEGLRFDDLKRLVPEDYAQHWNITLDFLKILSEHWPKILESEGVIDAADRRNRLLEAQRKLWEAQPPDHPVIAAGSTASIPAVADLLSTLARLDQGCVVLPGLDPFMDDADWAGLEPTHPQFPLKQLLDRLRMGAHEVEEWPHLADNHTHPMRAQLLSEAMLPASSTDKWRDLAHPPANVLDGVERVDCPTPFEEAGAIALMLRGELEKDGHTASLVTPDRNLARRVASELRRWNIEIDDSAGVPLHQSPIGTYLRLLAQCASDPFSPVSFLALCKHPLSACGYEPRVFRKLVRQLELLILRGPRPGPGFAGLRSALAQVDQRYRKSTGRLTAAQKQRLSDLGALIDQLEERLGSFIKIMRRKKTDLIKITEGHLKAAESFAASHDQNGIERIWAGDAGEAGADFFSDVLESAQDFGEIEPIVYANLLDGLMQGVAVRPKYGAHPRLSILGLFEARLHQADLIVMAGMNEGTWPPDVKATPWMSRPMMKDFGLPQPETVIGQTAHDFAQNFCAKRIIITRSERVDGTPTVRARWLRRLENRLSSTEIAAQFKGQAGWLSWQAALDHVAKVQAVAPPAPRPPLSARPREMYVTRVETWMRDPYAVYARDILKLRALEPIDADPGAADYGNIIHEILEKFMEAFPKELPEDAPSQLRQMGQETFGSELENPGIWAFWWPRFERIAIWFLAMETTRRRLIAKSYSEMVGSISVNGDFKLSAKADRLDLFKDGTLAIIDYKTGTIPTSKEVEAGFAPQLPLEAAIAMKGGFADLGAREISELSFWKLSGGAKPGEIKPASKDVMQSAQDALEGLENLIKAYDNPDTPYPSRPHPEYAPKFSDYGHLARVKEWTNAGPGDDE